MADSLSAWRRLRLAVDAPLPFVSRDTRLFRIGSAPDEQAQSQVAQVREPFLAADHFKMACNTAFRECRHGQTGFKFKNMDLFVMLMTQFNLIRLSD
jgi:hypothetical protein